MDLATYLSETNTTVEQLARKMGKTSASGIIKWVRKERTPRPDEQRKIFEVTKGAVTPNDFVLTERGAA